MSSLFILASASPSRLGILRGASIDPDVHVADIDEDALIEKLADKNPEHVVQTLATKKAEAIARQFPESIVLGCDSMLLIDGFLQGKPHSIDRAIERWKYQRGKQAQLLTGHCLLSPQGRWEEVTQTTIYFASPSDRDIATYARSGEPLECAGAFTLEAMGGFFIDRIEGDPHSVVGLSLAVVRRALYAFGMDISDFWAPTSKDSHASTSL
ncbi:Maf-like protein [Corynebacterium sp. ES2794-CONJ1]|uniref:Maf family protein n=1 Tax=unclassified Corynebacterium TaxID=2624378 RepID=UPI0021679BC7|nr:MULTISPECIES: nucleoside triphosphate pyrophosphatase [unclassified Corynebacterium]MCS4489512.1 Maf-like protein [Corynebacterium sp. ES2775-CONJ]MCS4491477.1 Maf-like protein [Corynebacterium sp. ES2715-CONJ3]MCS4531422.1 Maf-like protein [Corynebacterium sp. ES2730-CONJ]MCU9518810.1 Maf-like protein [Corynebacterium sp. ES2794-CONJ1]